MARWRLLLALMAVACRPPAVPLQGPLEKPLVKQSAIPTTPPELAEIAALQARLAKLQTCKGTTSCAPTTAPPSPSFSPTPLLPCETTQPDLDQDGLADTCETELAEKWAPVVYHSSAESNYPTQVDWFLARTTLWFYDESCTPDRKTLLLEQLTQQQLLEHSTTEGCTDKTLLRSDGTRSQRKQRTYYLADVETEARKGSLDTRDWRTYVHVFRNADGGATIQYWRFYAYNDALNNHGGDWEGVQVMTGTQFQPLRMALLGHTGIETVSWSEVNKFQERPLVFSEGGGTPAM